MLYSTNVTNNHHVFLETLCIRCMNCRILHQIHKIKKYCLFLFLIFKIFSFIFKFPSAEALLIWVPSWSVKDDKLFNERLCVKQLFIYSIKACQNSFNKNLLPLAVLHFYVMRESLVLKISSNKSYCKVIDFYLFVGHLLSSNHLSFNVVFWMQSVWNKLGMYVTR